MKICIVTVYNSINSGSFWQAYILGEYLKNRNNEVFYLKRNNKGSSASFLGRIKHLLSYFAKNGFNSLYKNFRMYREFDKFKKLFNIIQINNIEYIDCFVLGSDTIWNWDSKYFLNNINTYTGYTFPKDKRVVSYAASFANTDINTIKSIKEIKEKFNNINSISVRDEYSGNIVKDFFNRDYQLVCDPTMLFDKNDYKKYIKGNKEANNYILLYLFKKLTDEQLESIIKYAKENNKIIIEFNTVAVHNNNNVKIVINSPMNFLNYFYYADFIVTDTFHGTMFSVNLEKQFFVIDRKKKKVNDFLRSVNLNNRIIDSKNSLDDFNNKIIDYSTNEEITKLRQDSKNFIDNNICVTK